MRCVFRLLLPTVGYCSRRADRSQRKLESKIEFLTLTVLRGGNTHQGQRAKELYVLLWRLKLPLINIYLMSSLGFNIIARGEFKRTPAAHSQKEEKSDISQEMTPCLCQWNRPQSLNKPRQISDLLLHKRASFRPWIQQVKHTRCVWKSPVTVT